MAERKSMIDRKTSETTISLSLNLDGSGKGNFDTGIGFFDHMLNSFARHGFFDLDVKADGDLYVDCHHTIEDTGIVLGQAIKEALGDKRGIKRYGSMILPMDEALVLCAVDLSGRPYLVFDAEFSKDSVGKYLALFAGMETADDAIAYISEKLDGVLADGVMESFHEIIDSVEATKGDFFKLVFDPTLVRGMSYYTGTIFEIDMPEFGGSCGGGGRYDKMVGKFTGNDVPACGFSIGFERIILLLLESGFKVPKAGKKIAYLMEKGLPSENLCEVMAKAQAEREKGNQILVARMNKNKKFQKEQLTAQGYEEFEEFYKEELKR